MADEEKKIVDDLGELDLGEKKKKKKDKKEKKEKKEKSPALDDAGGELELDLKKKKKKKKTEDKKEEDVVGDLDLTKKKKKKTKDKSEKSEKSEDIVDLDLTGKSKKKKDKNKVVATERKMEELDEANMATYGYDTLLDRVFDLMEENSVGKGAKGFGKRIVCPPPQMVRIGTKKSGYQNFGITCQSLNRQAKHVMQYILAETGTSGNLDQKEQMILRGRFKPSHMENVLREYIKEYVQCATCKSANTVLEKLDRLTFMNCNDCSSRRTVMAMTAGFQALVGKRKKQREKGGAGTSNAMKAQ